MVSFYSKGFPSIVKSCPSIVREFLLRECVGVGERGRGPTFLVHHAPKGQPTAARRVQMWYRCVLDLGEASMGYVSWVCEGDGWYVQSP